MLFLLIVIIFMCIRIVFGEMLWNLNERIQFVIAYGMNKFIVVPKMLLHRYLLFFFFN